jgi:hypothetical protein
MADSHGNTPAAWTFVIVALLGFAVGGVALIISPIIYPLFWVGIGLIVLAGVIFIVMSKMGYHDPAH